MCIRFIYIQHWFSVKNASGNPLIPIAGTIQYYGIGFCLGKFNFCFVLTKGQENLMRRRSSQDFVPLCSSKKGLTHSLSLSIKQSLQQLSPLDKVYSSKEIENVNMPSLSHLHDPFPLVSFLWFYSLQNRLPFDKSKALHGKVQLLPRKTNLIA